MHPSPLRLSLSKPVAPAFRTALRQAQGERTGG